MRGVTRIVGLAIKGVDSETVQDGPTVQSAGCQCAATVGTGVSTHLEAHRLIIGESGSNDC